MNQVWKLYLDLLIKFQQCCINSIVYTRVLVETPREKIYFFIYVLFKILKFSMFFVLWVQLMFFCLYFVVLCAKICLLSVCLTHSLFSGSCFISYKIYIENVKLFSSSSSSVDAFISRNFHRYNSILPFILQHVL